MALFVSFDLNSMAHKLHEKQRLKSDFGSFLTSGLPDIPRTANMKEQSQPVSSTGGDHLGQGANVQDGPLDIYNLRNTFYDIFMFLSAAV